jgi:hypothetical protein
MESRAKKCRRVELYYRIDSKWISRFYDWGLWNVQVIIDDSDFHGAYYNIQCQYLVASSTVDAW